VVPDALLAYVHEQILQHCQTSKGYEEGPWVNPLVPADCSQIYLASDTLAAASRGKYEKQFIEFFTTR
jgi:hypothetical protein